MDTKAGHDDASKDKPQELNIIILIYVLKIIQNLFLTLLRLICLGSSR